MDVERIKEGMQGIFFIYSHHAVTKTVGVEGNINRENGRGCYGGSCCKFHAMRRRSRAVREILGVREDTVETEDTLKGMFRWLWFQLRER